jgi:hypothetical protein
MGEALVKIERDRELSDWSGAARRGLEARTERETIIAKVLKPGLDFGVIPGTDKPTLFKPGAEKIADSLSLYPDYESISRVEDWDRPLFAYSYRCHLRQRGSDTTIATGIGSCNSMESRYRWRKAERTCPDCGRTAIIKGKAEYGGGWVCFSKRGGCGAKFADGDAEIVSQTEGRVPNDDIFSLVNTIDKMAQKRALVAASLNLGFSEQFTQDMEDREPDHVEQGALRIENSATKHRPSAPPANTPADAPVWRGKLVKFETKEGTNKSGPWTLWRFHGNDGENFGTFSQTIAEGLLALDGKFVEIVYDTTPKGGKNVVEYRDVTAEEAPEP